MGKDWNHLGGRARWDFGGEEENRGRSLDWSDEYGDVKEQKKKNIKETIYEANYTEVEN